MFCLALMIQNFANEIVLPNSKSEIFRSNNEEVFNDKDWQIILKINKFYLEGIVNSKMKLESISELTPENLLLSLNITKDRLEKDMKEVQEAGMRLKERLKAKGIGCDNCGTNIDEKNSNILMVLKKMRQDELFSKTFYKSIEGLNSSEPQEPPSDGEMACAQPFVFLGCVAACTALGPVLNVICAAGCWCQFCRPGQC